jgi:hypothetical protein
MPTTYVLHCNVLYCQTAGVAQLVQCLTTDRPPVFDSQQRQRIFPLASEFRTALRPTQPPIQWVPRVLSWG